MNESQGYSKVKHVHGFFVPAHIHAEVVSTGKVRQGWTDGFGLHTGNMDATRLSILGKEGMMGVVSGTEPVHIRNRYTCSHAGMPGR